MARSCPADAIGPVIRSTLGAYLILSPVVFWYTLPEAFESCKAALTQVIALVLAVLCVAGNVRLHSLFSGPVGIAMATSAGLALFTTIFSICPRTSLVGAADSYSGLVHVVALAILFAATRASGADGDTLKSALVGLALVCGYALVQIVGLDPVSWQETSAVRDWQRPIGTQGHPNYLAGHAVMVLPLVVWWIGQRWQQGDRFRAILTLGPGVLSLLVVIAALSRASWLAGTMAILLLVVVWRVNRPFRIFFIFLSTTVVLLGLAWALAGDRLGSALLERGSAFFTSPGRHAVWAGAWQLFLKSPWTGGGLDTFGLAFPGVRTPAYWEVEWGLLPSRAHNDFLHALATQGVGGGFVYLFLAIALLWASVQAWNRRPNDRPLIAALSSALVAFYVQNLFGFAVGSTSGLFAIVAGTMARLAETPTARSERASPLSGRALVLPAILGWIILVASLWQGTHPATSGRFLVTAGITALTMGLAVVAIWRKVDHPCRTPVPWRALMLPALPATVLAVWGVICPLVAGLYTRWGDEWFGREMGRGIDHHQMAVSLAPWQDRPRLRLAFALLKAADQQTDPTIRKRMLLSAWQVAEAACEQVPRCASHHANRGRILLELARAGHVKPDAVFAAFDRALELDPCDSVACTDAARAATTLEQLDRAERYIDQGQRIDPNLGWLDAERAALALARRNLAEAETLLRQALEKDWHGNEDRLDRARLLQILILLQVGKATEANWVVETVLIRRPDWVQARWLHALVFERLGRRDEAIELFRYVLRLQPDNPHAHAGLVRLQATPNPTRTNEPRTK